MEVVVLMALHILCTLELLIVGLLSDNLVFTVYSAVMVSLSGVSAYYISID